MSDLAKQARLLLDLIRSDKFSSSVKVTACENFLVGNISALENSQLESTRTGGNWVPVNEAEERRTLAIAQMAAMLYCSDIAIGLEGRMQWAASHAQVLYDEVKRRSGNGV